MSVYDVINTLTELSVMLEYTFRFNTQCVITPFDKLDQTTREKYHYYENDRRFYGLLHAPRQSRLTVKAINRVLADFLNGLREPRLMRDALQMADLKKQEDVESFIIQLLLDSVLEVKIGAEFISGVDAVNRLIKSPPPEVGQPRGETPKKSIQTLSEQAIRFALQSPGRDPRDVSFILYNFNRIPASRRWRTRFPDQAALSRFLDLNDDGSWPGMPPVVKPQSIRIDEKGQPNPFDAYWRSWKLKGKKRSQDQPSYKVYFSPLPGDLPQVFRIVREAVVESSAHAMKICRTTHGILRPDKFIVYFGTYRAAREFAEGMSRALRSFSYQGTPFSFQISTENPMVTMGVDPPPRFGERQSWRLYLTNKLALAIQGCARNGANDPLDYIHTYLRLIGIDDNEWRPLTDDWHIEFRIEDGVRANS